MTVAYIQKTLVKDLMATGWKYFAFNTFALAKKKDYEADMISVSKTLTCAEFEIKCSRADFFADFKKVSKHEKLSSGQLHCNYFYYVCEKGLIKIDEVPSYAGLIYVDPIGEYILKVKPAPQMHRNRLTDKMLLALLTSVMHKYVNKMSA